MSKVYLLHFSQPYAHARHYMGFVSDGNVSRRLYRHVTGTGAKLTNAARLAGICFRLVRTWDGDRSLERQLKRCHNGPRYCPVCRAARKVQ